MQTFLPEFNFRESAESLDYKRLGKQRVEVLQLLKALMIGPAIDENGKQKKTPWYFHPACQMWIGNESSLIQYGLFVCNEWISRGYNDTCYDKIFSFRLVFTDENPSLPLWYNEDFVISHRSNLIRKNPEFYRSKWPNTPENLEYIWPAKNR